MGSGPKIRRIVSLELDGTASCPRGTVVYVEQGADAERIDAFDFEWCPQHARLITHIEDATYVLIQQLLVNEAYMRTARIAKRFEAAPRACCVLGDHFLAPLRA